VEAGARAEEAGEKAAMTIRREVVVSLDDLRFIRITCSHCNTTVNMDMQGEFKSSQQRLVFAPRACPGCHKSFDSAIENVDVFQRVYHTLAPIKQMLSFHGQPEQEIEPSEEMK
jgi:hypothetical protein